MAQRRTSRLRIIGVLDLMGGRAVHARAGCRDRYAPVARAAERPIEAGSARVLAQIYIDVLGVAELYAADLDAILERPPQDDITRGLASLGAPLWLDAGIRSVDDARRALALGAARVIVGLETLRSMDVLSAICAAVGGERVAFSLDLRDGRPITMTGAVLDADPTPAAIADLAAGAGVGTLIVIDLARVGTNRGTDANLIAKIHASLPQLALVAGGGVRGWDDLVQLAGAGCSAALVATALHDGRIGAREISTAREL